MSKFHASLISEISRIWCSCVQWQASAKPTETTGWSKKVSPYRMV